MNNNELKRYLIDAEVLQAEGSQVWYVDASSEAEALEKYEQGDGNIYANELEAIDLGEPSITGETTLDDFGAFTKPPLSAPIGTVDEVLDNYVINYRGYDRNALVYLQPQEPWGFHMQFNNGREETFKGLAKFASCATHAEEGEEITLLYAMGTGEVSK